MAAPKLSPKQLASLYPDKTQESPNLRDKKIIEALRMRLNDKIANDPKMCKKAALILEQWIHQKK